MPDPSRELTSRGLFLRRLIGTPVAAAAGVVAATVDPDGEPPTEAAPLIHVTGNGVTLQNLVIDAGSARRDAVRYSSPKRGRILMRDTTVVGQIGSWPAAR